MAFSEIADLLHSSFRVLSFMKTARIPIRLKRGKNELRIKNNNFMGNNRWLWAISCVLEKKVVR